MSGNSVMTAADPTQPKPGDGSEGSGASWDGQSLSDGRYKVLSRLGEGSMGLVYRVWDNRLESEVVLKIPRDRMMADPEYANRFEREIRSLVKMSHPHIVKVLDVGQHEGVPFVVMQFLAGGSLRDRLYDEQSQQVKLPAPRLKEWVLEVAKALDFIHSQGIVHRDVKPANILFDSFGNAFLSDFGLAKAKSTAEGAGERDASLTAAGFLVGTPNYVAPESVMGLEQDGRVDQYSLAMTVYEVLTGSVPVEGPTASATMVNQTSMKIPPLTEALPGISPALSLAVARGLRKRAEQRFETCVEFAQAVLDGLSNASQTTATSAANGNTQRTRSVAATAQRESARSVTREAPPAPPPPAPPRRKAANDTPPLPSRTSSGKLSKGRPGLVKCPHCRKALPIPGMFAGRRARCAQCFALVQVGPDRDTLRLLAAPDQEDTVASKKGGKTKAAALAKKRKADGADVAVLGEEVFGIEISKTVALALLGALVFVLVVTSLFIGRETNAPEVEKIKEQQRIQKSGNRES